MYSLSNLGAAETFVSHAKNALVKSDVLADSVISVDLAPLSINSIILKSNATAVNPDLKKNTFKASVYPNPATDQVHLDFSLPERGRVKFDLYSGNGQLIKTISNSVFESGNQSTSFDLNNTSSGIYWIKLTTKKDSQTLKIIKK
jgi:hypothetical protein